MSSSARVGANCRLHVCDNIAIGVNSVVTKSLSEPEITIVGAPARKISDIRTSGFSGFACSSIEQDLDADREPGQDH